MSAFTALLVLTSMTGVPSHTAALTSIQQDTLTVKEAEPGLRAQAKVTSDSAMRTALGKVPGGTISEAELEKEHGKLVYSFDIHDSKKAGVQEVLVDAKSGKVVSSTHESTAAEAKEHAADMKHDSTMMKHDSAR